MNAIQFYRVGRWFYLKKIPIIPSLIKKITFLIFNSYIPPSAQIGSGTVFAYGAIGVVLHDHCTIGENCVIGQGVTVGAAEPFFSKEINLSPQIGNNCYIASGSKILGNIKVGDNSIVGAGSVLLSSIDNNSVAAGSPARIIKNTESDYLAIRKFD